MSMTPEEREIERERAQIQARAMHDEAMGRAKSIQKKVLIAGAVFLVLVVGMCSMG